MAGARGAKRSFGRDDQEREGDEHLRDDDRRGRERNLQSGGSQCPAEHAAAPQKRKQRDAADERRKHERQGRQRAQDRCEPLRAPRDHEGERNTEDHADDGRDRRGGERERERLHRRRGGDRGRNACPVQPCQEGDERQHEHKGAERRGDGKPRRDAPEGRSRPRWTGCRPCHGFCRNAHGAPNPKSRSTLCPASDSTKAMKAAAAPGFAASVNAVSG